MINIERLWTSMHIGDVSWILFFDPRRDLLRKQSQKETVAQSPGADLRATPKSESKSLWVFGSKLLGWKMPKNEPAISLKTFNLPSDPEVLLNVVQTHTMLSCSRGTLYNLIRSGEIKPIKIRSSTRFRRSEIDRFISARTAQSSSQN